MVFSLPHSSGVIIFFFSFFYNIYPRRYIPIGFVPTMMTIVDSHAQVFFDFTATFRTQLRSPPSVNFSEELSSFPAHILNNASKLTKGSIKHMFSKHSLGTSPIIQVFHEDHITDITKGVGLLVVKVFPRVVNLMVKSSNFDTLFLVILRPLLSSRQSALQ